MWNIYFGEWSTGRLKRLSYLGYGVLLMAISFAVIIGVVMLGGGLENMMGADTLAGMGIVAMLFSFLFFIAMFISNLNIMAKRIRDMGLPAWRSVVVIIILSIVLEMLFSGQQVAMSTAAVSTPDGLDTTMDMNASEGSVVSGVFNLIVFLALVLIPSDTFGNRKEETEA